VVSGAALERMLAASPIAFVDRVRTPSLVALGQDDRRVPPSQGIEWHRALRERGVPSRILWYDNEAHPIGRVRAVVLPLLLHFAAYVYLLFVLLLRTDAGGS
jgi:dipeptidyl aminopeptidase/acylaminoacyl peptidase